MYHEDLKQHIRVKQRRRKEKMMWLPKNGDRVPVDGLEASRVAAEYLELKPAKVIRL